MVRHRSCTLAWVWVFFLVAASLPVAGQAKPAGTRGAKRLALARDKVVQDGLRATLPPHLATLLGLTKDQECAVLQGVLRSGKSVQGFDVSVENKNDIVIFVVDESSNSQNLYLTSTLGRLRKMVVVKGGVGQVSKITDAGRNEFEKEKEFWLARLVPSPAPK